MEIDPLQHHGVFFINSNSFHNYWLMDLPISTLEKALFFSEKKELNIKFENIFLEKYSSSCWISDFINRYKELPINLNSGVYVVKRFISELLLIPVLILAVKKIYVYKGDSFSLAEKFYGKKGWKCIEMASLIRINWNQEKINPKYKGKRNYLFGREVEEFNAFTEVVNFSEDELSEFIRCFEIFRKETSNILITFKNDF